MRCVDRHACELQPDWVVEASNTDGVILFRPEKCHVFRLNAVFRAL